MRERIQTEEVCNTWRPLTTGIAVSCLGKAQLTVSNSHAAYSKEWLYDSSGKKAGVTPWILCRLTSDAVCNRTAGGVLRDIARRLYRGVLYFQNVTRVHDTHANVISSRATSKIWLPSATFRETDNQQQLYVQICYSWFDPNRTVDVENAEGNLFTPR